MKLICQICKLPLSSKLEKEDEAVTDVVSLLKSHSRLKHKEQFRNYEDHLSELISAFKAMPAFLFLGYFADLENSETNDRVGMMSDQLMEVLGPVEDLFIKEEEEVEEVELKEECPEKEEEILGKIEG